MSSLVPLSSSCSSSSSSSRNPSQACWLARHRAQPAAGARAHTHALGPAPPQPPSTPPQLLRGHRDQPAAGAGHGAARGAAAPVRPPHPPLIQPPLPRQAPPAQVSARGWCGGGAREGWGAGGAPSAAWPCPCAPPHTSPPHPPPSPPPPRSLGMDPDTPTVLLCSGGEGMGPVEATVAGLAAHVGARCQLVVICGRNARLAERLARRCVWGGGRVRGWLELCVDAHVWAVICVCKCGWVFSHVPPSHAHSRAASHSRPPPAAGSTPPACGWWSRALSPTWLS